MILPTPSKNRVELDAELRSAKSELEAAEKELERVQELYKDKIVARRRLEQSERDVAVQRARLDAARAQLGLLDPSQAPGKAERPRPRDFLYARPSPEQSWRRTLTPGALVEAGQNLLSIVDLERVWIEGRLYEIDIPKVRQFEKSMVCCPGAARAIRADSTQSALAEYRQRHRSGHSLGAA